MKITKLAQNELEAKERELRKFLEKSREQAPVFELKKAEAELAEIETFLKDAEVVEFSEKEPAIVLIGTRVTLENLKTGDTREYTILTRTTANPLKGVISNESPLAQKILNLKLGNTFKFADNTGQEETFKIKLID